MSTLLKQAATRFRMTVQGIPLRAKSDKIELIDYAFTHCRPQPESFADLGGVWGVNGAYTFYILRQYQPESAFLVDTDFTGAVKKEKQSFNNLQLISGNFGDPATAEKIGTVGAILLFDVLLHQVSPDWDQILKTYADRTRCFIIYNQQWTGSDKTVRLLDLGREEYFQNVPHDPAHPTYQNLFDKMHEMHPQHQRPWRDIHNVWQWGITDQDLIEKVEGLGFKQLHYKNHGRFGSLRNFENHAFVFQKA